jgi:hypothetical protein
MQSAMILVVVLFVGAAAIVVGSLVYEGIFFRGPAGQVTVGGTVHLDSARARRERILKEIEAHDTYIPAMLAESDSMLRRWHERAENPVTVWLEEDVAHIPGFSTDHAQAVRNAFARWQRVGDVPVTFRFDRDSSRADVLVRWIERFPLRRAGQADVVWNRRGWLIRGGVTLATHSADGRPLSPEAVYTVALHEIGHLIGLGHSDAVDDVMYPSTSVHDLTLRDRRSAQLLYLLPPGSLRVPVRLAR